MGRPRRLYFHKACRCGKDAGRLLLSHETRWDSGWRFMAGDESHEYMDKPENSGIYKLITIVSIDPDVLPLLKAPCGSAFERDEKGIFHQVDDWHLE